IDRLAPYTRLLSLPDALPISVCLAECAMTGATHFGISVELNDDLDAAALLFGEAQGRIVVSCAAASAPEVIEAAAGANVAAAVIDRKSTRLNSSHVKISYAVF